MNSENSSVILVIQELAQLAASLQETNEIVEKLNNRVSELNQSMRKLERYYGEITLPFQSSVYEYNVQKVNETLSSAMETTSV